MWSTQNLTATKRSIENEPGRRSFEDNKLLNTIQEGVFILEFFESDIAVQI